MTLVGVLKLQNKIVLGTDSHLVVHGRASVPAQKSFVPASAPSLRWAYAGDQPVGLAFEEWIDNHAIATWENLVEESTDELARLNQKARARAAMAGTSNEPVEIILAGDLDGEQRVYYLDDAGGSSEHPTNPMFIGAGSASAFAAWNTATRLIGDQPSDEVKEAAFRAVVASVVETVLGLGPPEEIHVLNPPIAPA
jgi:hypothetical protein